MRRLAARRIPKRDVGVGVICIPSCVIRDYPRQPPQSLPTVFPLDGDTLEQVPSRPSLFVDQEAVVSRFKRQHIAFHATFVEHGGIGRLIDRREDGHVAEHVVRQFMFH